VCQHVVVAGLREVVNNLVNLPYLGPSISFGQHFIARFGALNISLVSGGLAYYVILALAPLAISIGAVAGIFVNQTQFTDGWDSLVSRAPDSLSGLDTAVDSLSTLAQTASAGSVTITSIVSVVVAIYVSQKVVHGVLRVQDQIFLNVRAAPGLFARAKSALISLTFIVIAVSLLMAVTVVPAILKSLDVETTFLSLLDSLGWLAPAILVYFVVWFVMRKTSGSTGVLTWRSPGLLVSTVLIIASIGIFGIYVDLSSTVGSALVVFGAPIAVLIWVFLTFLAFFSGSIVEAIHRDRCSTGKPTWGAGNEGDKESTGSGTDSSAEHRDSWEN
jgi:membrane protein